MRDYQYDRDILVVLFLNLNVREPSILYTYS